jgi:ParB-like chromosome segregation protein Spo0J
MTEYAFHELATVFPLLEGGEYTALIDDIRTHGLLEPITLFEGKILDGRNRYRACLAAGVEPRFREILFGDYAEAAACVISANIHRRHLTAEQRRELIEKLLKADPGQSDRQIAEMAKVSDKTVAAVRREAEARAEIPHVEKRTDRKGRSQPARKEKSLKVGKAQRAVVRGDRSEPKPELALSDRPSSGPPPELLPPSPVPESAPSSPRDDAERAAFKNAAEALGCLTTKPAAKFAGVVPADSLITIADFLNAVVERGQTEPSSARRELEIKNLGLESEV